MCFIDLVETRNKFRDFYFSFIFRYDKIDHMTFYMLIACYYQVKIIIDF